jgi:hypothetical protein
VVVPAAATVVDVVYVVEQVGCVESAVVVWSLTQPANCGEIVGIASP